MFPGWKSAPLKNSAPPWAGGKRPFSCCAAQHPLQPPGRLFCPTPPSGGWPFKGLTPHTALRTVRQTAAPSHTYRLRSCSYRAGKSYIPARASFSFGVEHIECLPPAMRRVIAHAGRAAKKTVPRSRFKKRNGTPFFNRHPSLVHFRPLPVHAPATLTVARSWTSRGPRPSRTAATPPQRRTPAHKCQNCPASP